MSQKSDLDSLFAFVAPFAQELLRRHGEFLPFAAIMSPAGDCSGLSVSPETTGERPVREILTEALKEKVATGTCRAVAICGEVEMKSEPGTSAILAYLEHEGGLALQVAVPFRRTNTGELAYAPTRASRGVPHSFFPARPLH